MEYHFYNPHENKVYVARHAELFKNILKCTRSVWESHFAKSEWEYCRNDAHYGYNCPPKVSIVPNLEPFNNQTVDELPPTVPSFDPTCYSKDGNSFTYDSKSNLVHDSPNIFDPPSQPPFYSCEFCGNDARYVHYCTPQVPFIYPKPCYNQDFNFPQDFHDFQQQYLCCENCEVTHEAYQCQPMNEDYYHEQNSCYDPNSFIFDQFQTPQYTVNHPIFNAQNDLFNSQNKLVEQLTSMCNMVGQFMQKKEEEKQIEEEQAAKTRYWKIPACYDDDDDDYTIAITHKEPNNSLSMGDEHLDTIPATESDEFIKYSLKTLSQTQIDSLFDEFAGELTLLKSIPPGINETDCDPEEETRFIKRLLCDNSYPRPPKEFISENSDATFESFSPSPIPVEDNDSLMEELDLSFTPDDPMPLYIEEDDYDSEGDIIILEKFLSNDSLSFPENKSFHFDIPLSSRPPAKPPDGNPGILNVKVRGDISEHKGHMPRLKLALVLNQEKSPKLLPHQGHDAFQSSTECPMMIYRKNTHILDVIFFHFYPLNKLKYGGIASS
nr:hypothetical protein [Tanacetum cinerariifolium]